MVNIKVTTKGKADLDKLLKEYAKQAAHVKVGILEAKTVRKSGDPGDTLTNAAIARVHEYGSRGPKTFRIGKEVFRIRGIPARPFLRPTFEKNKTAYVELFGRIFVAATAKPELARKALELIGMKAQADVRKYVTAGPQIPPPNSAKYFAWKSANKARLGSAFDPRTLVLTGQMVRAINYEVVRGKSSHSGNKPIVNTGRYGGGP